MQRRWGGNHVSRNYNSNRRVNDLVEETRRHRHWSMVLEGIQRGSGLKLNNESSRKVSVNGGENSGVNSNLKLGVDSGHDFEDRSKGNCVDFRVPINSMEEDAGKIMRVTKLIEFGLSTITVGSFKVGPDGLLKPGDGVVGLGPVKEIGYAMKGVGKLGVSFSDKGIRPSKIIINRPLLQKVDGPKWRN
ncbi:hypothetical protein QYF36_004140 [Acer negundo]|nr:hypothetical protein QYF36_004140 [Acer negundo]